MAKVAALLLLAFCACASRDAVISERFYDCEPGQDVSVDVAANAPRVRQENVTDHFTMVVEVSNNAHSDIEVKAIRVEPSVREHASYEIERSYRRFNHVLAGGESKQFELPISGRGLMRDPNVRTAGDVLGVIVSVYLANGDTYRCELNFPAPR